MDWPSRDLFLDLEDMDAIPWRFGGVRREGISDMLTAKLANRLFVDRPLASVGSSSLLIDTKVHSLSFKGSRVRMDGEPIYAALAPANIADHQGLVWRWILEVTPDITSQDALHQELCENTFDCVIMNTSYGLCTRTHNGKTERIGRIKLQGELAKLLETGDYVGVDSDVDSETVPLLQTYFPGSRRTILLE